MELFYHFTFFIVTFSILRNEPSELAHSVRTLLRPYWFFWSLLVRRPYAQRRQ